MIPPRCLIVQGNLGRFVDGGLSARPAAAVSEHLQGCPRCLEAERMARAIPVMLASPLHPPAPPLLLPSLLAAFRRRRRRERRLTAVAFAFALLVAGATLVDPALLPSQGVAARPVPAPATPRVVPDSAASLAAGKPTAAEVAGPSLSSGLRPSLQVGQFTVPKLAATPCPTRRPGKAAGGPATTCQTEATPKRPNTP